MGVSQLSQISQINDYIGQQAPPEAPLLHALRQKTEAEVAFPHMLTARSTAQLLQLLLQLIEAKRVLEVGVYTGYSTLAMAMVLPEDACIVACDHSEPWTAVAKAFWQKAGVDDRIDLHVAKALDTLERLTTTLPITPFDFIFIDADKINYPNYLQYGYQLLRQNGLMLFDNTLFVSSGNVMQADNATTRAIAAFNQQIKHDERFDRCLLAEASGVTILRKR